MAYTKQSVNQTAQIYFKEYKQLCQQNPQYMMDELKSWSLVDNLILDMPLEEQARYADYVTVKVCLLGSNAAEQMAEASVDHSCINGYSQAQKSCAVGNYAKLILEMKDATLKEKHLKLHESMIKYAKEKRCTN